MVDITVIKDLDQMSVETCTIYFEHLCGVLTSTSPNSVEFIRMLLASPRILVNNRKAFLVQCPTIVGTYEKLVFCSVKQLYADWKWILSSVISLPW